MNYYVILLVLFLCACSSPTDNSFNKANTDIEFICDVLKHKEVNKYIHSDTIYLVGRDVTIKEGTYNCSNIVLIRDLSISTVPSKNIIEINQMKKVENCWVEFLIKNEGVKVTAEYRNGIVKLIELVEL